MLKKPFKVITLDNELGKTINIYGNNHWIELEYDKHSWSDEEVEACFKYKGNTYFLSEFMNIHNKIHEPNPPEWLLEFDGYMADSYYSGVLIKLGITNEAVKVFTYIC
jgi:hypothetical protein